jgi:hypothetical protein
MATKAKPRLTADGVPVDANDWLEADWIDMHYTLERLKHRIAARHREKRCPIEANADDFDCNVEGGGI